jgi:AAA family ATP:ADP antiporter
MSGATRPARLTQLVAQVQPGEGRAVSLAFCCFFVLLGSYYVLRPLRDSMATVFTSAQLSQLFTVTFVFTLVFSAIFGVIVSRVRLTRFLPGVFWFWLANIVLFYALFRTAPENRWVAGSYFVWFSVVNLFMISVFWSLMVDLFSPEQAPRVFPVVAAGGSLGAVMGPLVTRALAASIGTAGLVLVAAAGFLLVIVILHQLMREKERFRASDSRAQQSTLDHGLEGSALDGFKTMLGTPIMRSQALFMLLMTWINTIAYFLQTDIIARSFEGMAARTQAIADIDLWVNIGTVVILVFGLGRFVQRFGVTAGLILNPLMMLVAFVAVALSPTLLMVQGIQILRRVAQYAIARPSREMCFTVVPQESRYKAKNVIDTVIYRLGDVSAAWMQAGLQIAGFGLAGVVVLGLGASVLWSGAAAALGRRYEQLRGGRNVPVVVQ